MRCLWLGRQDYATIWALQRAAVEARVANACGDLLFLVEHGPTITLGRSADERHVLADPEELARRGVGVYRIERGGDVTFHGPGQLVGYPIVDLAAMQPDLHWFLRGIEQSLILALAHLGIAAERLPPHTGVWVGGAKVAAIGIRVRRWVTMHGFALNVEDDLSGFDAIVPCGLHGFSVTSVSRLLGRSVSLEEVAPLVLDGWRRTFGWRDEEKTWEPASLGSAVAGVLSGATEMAPPHDVACSHCPSEQDTGRQGGLVGRP